MPKFSVTESSRDGVDSGQHNINPLKSPIIFINALVNKYQLRILVDTGATKTFISNRIVHRITSKKDILKQPYSFLLADGLAPFRVLGNVNLTIQFDSLVTTIDAHIAEFLCTDMIIGMDYINKYNLNINVKRQVITIESNQSLVEVPIIRPTKSIKIP
ncbi:unnamed protein product, partial [Rotaria magnacalcarata]